MDEKAEIISKHSRVTTSVRLLQWVIDAAKAEAEGSIAASITSSRRPLRIISARAFQSR